MTEQKTAAERMSSGRRKPRVRISLVERDGLPFLRLEYEDYSPIENELKRRGLQKHYSYRLWGTNCEGYFYRYTSNERILPEEVTRMRINGYGFDIRVVDDINTPVIQYDSYYDAIIVNVAIFRAVPRKEGDIFVVEAPVSVPYLPYARRFFHYLVKTYKKYLLNFIEVKKVKMSVEFW